MLAAVVRKEVTLEATRIGGPGLFVHNLFCKGSLGLVSLLIHSVHASDLSKQSSHFVDKRYHVVVQRICGDNIIWKFPTIQ